MIIPGRELKMMYYLIHNNFKKRLTWSWMKPRLTYGSFPPDLDPESFGFVPLDASNALFEGLSLFVQVRVVLHLFILPRIPILC